MVQGCLQRQVELLNDAYNDWSKLGDIIVEAFVVLNSFEIPSELLASTS
jgi:hypothetical protein